MVLISINSNKGLRFELYTNSLQETCVLRLVIVEDLSLLVQFARGTNE